MSKAERRERAAKKDLDAELIKLAMQVADTALMNIHQLVAKFGGAGNAVAALAMVAISEMHENALQMAIEIGKGPSEEEQELYNLCRQQVRKAQEAQAEEEKAINEADMNLS